MFKKEKHPKFGKKNSVETNLAISEGIKEFYRKHDHHAKGKKGKFSPQFGKGGTQITMTDEQGTIMTFPSINSARLHFRVRFSAISKNINKFINNKYYLTNYIIIF